MHAHQSHCGPIAIALAFDQHPINRIGRTQGTARFSRHHRERPAMGLRQQHMRQTQHASVVDDERMTTALKTLEANRVMTRADLTVARCEDAGCADEK